ncbi:MAG TPA: glycoside hydrolase family 9 protein [Polyangia bacterium]|nr:glycoside hydrolase family 9 protein [Polyangia bacterium]
MKLPPLLLVVVLLPAVVRAKSAMTIGPSAARGKNILWNGTFDGETLRPWSVGFESSLAGRATVDNHGLCVQIDRPGTSPASVVIRQRPLAVASGHHYQLRFRAHATRPSRLRARLSKIDAPYTELWAASADLAPEARGYQATFDSTVDDDNVELALDLGGPLAGAAPVTVCLDDVELNDPRATIPIERLRARAIPRVRVNQVGYLPGLAKIATVVTAGDAPLEWRLVDAAGRVRASGKTRPFGDDRSSGERVQQIDFSSVTATGRGFRLQVGDDESVAFAIGADVYRRLKYDALAFFYLQRSGIAIEMPYAGSRAYERPAGHPGDKNVPCSPGAPCDYVVDASGGWYDAGDHGKYVVNGGFTVWLLQNQYEILSRFGGTAASFGDGKMKIPESKNGRPDLLDEARWGLDLFLRLQVPAGQPMAGMVHQKIHGEKWSDIPTSPAHDDIKRFVRPVSTAATLNLAAAAAQAARLWRQLDPSFSARCLAAAETAFAAATHNPFIRAEPDTPGGGAYSDGEVDDERYWAATDLFITTGKSEYKDELVRSRFHAPKTGAAVMAGIVGWDHVAPLGKISLVVAPNGLGEEAIAAQRQQLVAAADRLIGIIARRGYRVPMASDSIYNWGSNGVVLNGALVLGVAYDLTGDPKYANAVVDCMDYILGRNPLAFSYVSGYGTYAMRNPHHRVWAHMKDPALPEAPPGALAGGPNSALQDPYIRRLGMGGCPPQTCYVDNTDSYSTNEVAINWNAELAWTAAFLDDLAERRPAGTPRNAREMSAAPRRD